MVAYEKEINGRKKKQSIPKNKQDVIRQFIGWCYRAD
jgi:hypothetical protein